MKKILFSLLLACGFIANAQVYNNEWIDYSKTYYKFKGGAPGVYRIPQSVLSSLGLGSTPAEYFQLWRNGVQVPIFTTIPAGTMASSDYIEFWNVWNDGKPDKELYRDPSYQLNDYVSLETDTATYFLTVNPSPSNNRRLKSRPNNVSGNTLPEEPYFMYKAVKLFRDVINPGYAVNVGENLYSSSYDKGEGIASADIYTSSDGTNFIYGTNTFQLSNLYVNTSGPAPKFKINVSGNAVNTRSYKVTINGDSVIGNEVDFFNISSDSTLFSLNTIASGNAEITITNHTNCSPVACPLNDRLVAHLCEMTYPRQFNFGGANFFEFNLPATGTGNFLKITNFSFGTTPPVLYDMTNDARYVADMSAPSVLQFALPPSSLERNLVLVSEDPTAITYVSDIKQKTFINYTASAFQGDYLIISNPILYNGANGTNPVEEYRAYRSSAAGGAYNAKIYEADELVDQFGFGIKKNPAAIRNFIRYARNKYSVKPKQVFLIGKGVSYVDQRNYEPFPNLDQLNLVPTFGFPASDVLLTAEPGTSTPKTPIGRLSVVSAQEVADYLQKVKETEIAQAAVSPGAERAWMKNVVHIIGASEPGLEDQLTQYMLSYRDIIKDTLFGGDVTFFSKKTSNSVEQINNPSLENLFSQGISLITYFGHSSTTTLEFNLDNPENYNNNGKYPLFIGLGCNAGNFFNYSPSRLLFKTSLSENYVLSPGHGTIGFIASTYFGIPYYLDIWASRAYKQMSSTGYGKTIGEIMVNTAADVYNYANEDFYARCNTEQAELNGDPAIRLNPHAKPDYVIEDPMVKVSPGFVSVADASFDVKANILNIGKAINKNIVVEVKRQFPDQSIVTVYRDTLPGIRYTDSILVKIPVTPSHDKGLNKIIVTVDADNAVDELYETNNSITKDVMIYEDEARPAYPYNYSIVNHQNIKLIASTANPFTPSKQYRMELDTTALFNSPLKITKTLTSAGGILEFEPGVSMVDSTVYYWRVAPETATGSPTWNMSSFVYMANGDAGFNQSHYFQQLNSDGTKISLDSASRTWHYGTITQNLFLKMGSYYTSGSTQEEALSVSVNNVPMIRLTNWFSSLVFNVFDPVTFKPWYNQTVLSSSVAPDGMGQGLYGSLDNNAWFAPEPRYFNFEFRYTDTSSRRKIMNFMQNVIPDGAYVVVRNFTLDPNTFGDRPVAYVSDWKADEGIYGPGQSVYQYLKNAGFAGVDSFYRARPFGFVYKKNDPSFTPKWTVGQGVYDNPTLTVDCTTSDTLGYITSPQFGPAKQWKELKWNGAAMEGSVGDAPTINLIGIQTNGTVDTVMRNITLSQKTVDISSINAKTYPYLQMRMRNIDTAHYTPYQLRYWRLTGTPAPEGAVAPNVFFSMKDTLDVAEPMDFKFAFKNISEMPFTDSLKVKLTVTDRNNVSHVFPTWKQKPLVANDTMIVHYPADTRQLVGANSIYVEVNPDKDQPEQYSFNNFIYKNVYVRADTVKPLLDVTFDDVHILNNDIVSSKPSILINLKDESKWYMLDDNSTLSVKVKYPDGSLHPYAFNTDTLQFMAAKKTSGNENTASALFKPYFPQDGNYELIVTGKDMSQNNAGTLEYRIAFQVINKPMISNMLNYPNPFTTSTAFVFTVTGSEVPQNIRIQILTITGKVIREITKEELGPIHIGRNITEFKWDGTDQYGQKVGNGVYLYRVITNLNGKSLDKYTADGDNTDKYFNKGYGKMYLMR